MFCAARDSNAPYKLICLDIVMPEADGHEVLKAIRDLESEAGQVGDSSTKVIMVSGVTAGEDGYEAYSSGCDAYLVKPIDRQKLVQQLRHFDLIGEEIEL